MRILITLVLLASSVALGAQTAGDAGAGEAWAGSLELALEQAARDNRPIAVLITAGSWCDPCTWFADNSLASPQVRTALQDARLRGTGDAGWITARISDTDPAWQRWNIERLPTLLYLSPAGDELARSTGAVTADTVVAQLRSIAGRYAGASATNPAAADPGRAGTQYLINNGRIWNDGGGRWYTQDAGLPSELIEYDRDASFLYLQDPATGTLLAITVAAEASPSLWRWDVDSRRWRELGALRADTR